MARPNRGYYSIILLFFIVCAALGSWAIFRAHGYRVLTHPLRIVKTAVISVKSHPSDGVAIVLNGQTMPVGQTAFRDLTPGRYTIVASKTGFQNWETTVDLKAGIAAQFPNVVLYYSDVAPTLVTSSTQQVTYQALLKDPSRFQQNLLSVDNELWADDKLVTRFSQPIAEAMWLPGEHQILLLIDQTLHVIDIDSGQDFTVVRLPSDSTDIKFAPIAGGQKVVVSVGGVLSTYTITTDYPVITFPSF